MPMLLAVLHATHVLELPLVGVIDRSLDDARMRSLAPHTLDPRIVIVDIDEASLAVLGRWPWPRATLARLSVELLERQQVAALGFDVLIAESDNNTALARLDALAAGPLHDVPGLAQRWSALRPSLDEDAQLARALEGRPVVLGFYLTDDPSRQEVGAAAEPPRPLATDTQALAGLPLLRWSGYAYALPAIARAAPRSGFINWAVDGDGLLRSVPLIALHQLPLAKAQALVPPAQAHAALSLALLRTVLNEPAVQPRIQSTALSRALTAIELTQGDQRTRVPVSASGTLRVPYRGAGGVNGGSFQYVSAAALISGRIDAGALAGKVAIIGTSVPSLGDLRATPMGLSMPGVEVHAHLLSGLLDGRLIAPPDWSAAWSVALSLLLGALALWMITRWRAPWALAAVALAVAAAVALDRALLLRNGWLMPLATPLLAVLATIALALVWEWWTALRARRALQALFGRYLSPQLVQRMARSPEAYAGVGLGAENRELTVLFCDLRDFTRAAQGLPPEQVRELVNLFFSRMSAVIHARGGTLDKFIGDAIMAFWGAPLDDAAHAAHAAAAAVEMGEALADVNAALAARGLPPVGLGIGLNTGMVCVGDLGSELRRSYTVIGDAVNLASRIESLTREYGVDLLVGEATRAAGAARDGGRWCGVDRVRVKGRTAAVSLFTLVRDAPDGKDPARDYELALAAYRGQHWDQARALLQPWVAAGAQGGALGHRLPARLLERVERLRADPPPANWDGVQDFAQK
jgi:adenylate cyclase